MVIPRNLNSNFRFQIRPVTARDFPVTAVTGNPDPPQEIFFYREPKSWLMVQVLLLRVFNHCDGFLFFYFFIFLFCCLDVLDIELDRLSVISIVAILVISSVYQNIF
jgi:hypothetical protein